MINRLKFFCVMLGFASMTLVAQAAKTADCVNPNIVTIIQSDDEVIEIEGEEGDFDEFVDDVQTSSASAPKQVWRIIGSILVLLLYVAMLAHMVYELFIRKSPYSKNGYTLEDMKQARAESGKAAELSQGEMTTVNNLLNEVTSGWTEYEGCLWPTDIKQVRNAENALARLAEAMPTDPDVIARMNELVKGLNENKKRHFNGSMKLVIFTIIIAVVIGLLAKSWDMIPFFLGSLIVYYGASLTPAWMLVKREMKGKDNNHLSSKLISGIFAFIGSAQTVRTVTKWSDGTTTTDDDHSQHFIFWIIGLFLLIMLVFFIGVWAIFNYVRNYLLYK